MKVLRNIMTGEEWGTLGTPSTLKDSCGNSLSHGDLVALYVYKEDTQALQFRSLGYVCEDGGVSFIDGIRGSLIEEYSGFKGCEGEIWPEDDAFCFKSSNVDNVYWLVELIKENTKVVAGEEWGVVHCEEA